MNSYPKKSVCFICYRKFPDTNFENYSHFVSENGYDVTVVAFKDVGQKSFEITGNKKVYRISLPQTKYVRRKWGVFAAWVIKFLRRNQFSIVHIHNTCPYFLLYKILTNNPSKYVYHNTSYPVSTSRFGAYKRMITDFLQTLFMDIVMIQSEELKEKLLGIRNLKKTQVIPIGFNPRLFGSIKEEEKPHLRKRLGIPSGIKVLVYVGSMTRFRQLHRLIQAFALVCKVNKDVKLLMVGDGEDRMRLTSLVYSLGIKTNVIFTGKVPHEKVVDYLCASDIGISYVPINENYSYNPPLKTFEYLSCRLPVIATKTVSNSMIIQDQINGLLVKDNDKDLSIAIIDLLDNHSRLQLIKQNTRKSVEGQDFETITQKHILPLYSDLLAKK